MTGERKKDWRSAGYPSKSLYQQDRQKHQKEEWELLGYSSRREWRQDTSRKHNNPLRGRGREFVQLNEQIQISLAKPIRDIKVRLASISPGPSRDENLQKLRSVLPDHEDEIFEKSKSISSQVTPNQEIDLEGLAELLGDEETRNIILDANRLGIKPGDVKNPENFGNFEELLSRRTITKVQPPDVPEEKKKLFGIFPIGKKTATKTPENDDDAHKNETIYEKDRRHLG